MSFESFDATMLIENSAFLPQGPLAEAPENRGPTLDNALQQAAAASGTLAIDRQAMREAMREATALDLWIERASGTAFTALNSHDADQPAPLRKLSPDEMALIAGGSGSDMNGEGGGYGGSDVLVIGPYWDWNFPSNDPGDQYPSGSGSGGSDASPDLHHDETCGSEDGAAKQIADVIKKAPAVTGRGDWTQIEMGTLVVRTADGRYGALESTIYTDNQITGVTIPNVWGDDYVEGIVHNHPDSLGDNQIDLINRYPSAADWVGLEVLYNAYSPHYPGYDPSIWIMDRWGDLREFKFSERAAIEGMSEPQKTAGQGLEGRERTSSCS